MKLIVLCLGAGHQDKPSSRRIRDQEVSPAVEMKLLGRLDSATLCVSGRFNMVA